MFRVKKGRKKTRKKKKQKTVPASCSKAEGERDRGSPVPLSPEFPSRPGP